MEKEKNIEETLREELLKLRETEKQLTLDRNENLLNLEICEYYPMEIRELYNNNAIKSIAAQIITVVLLFSIGRFSVEALAASLFMGAAINVYDNRKPRRLQKELNALNIEQLEQKQDEITIELAKIKNLLETKQNEYNSFMKEKRILENKLYNIGKKVLEEKSKVKTLRK